jgi:hypothetical protein
MQILPLEAESFQTDGQTKTDGHDEYNTVVGFCNFANAPKTPVKLEALS